MKTLPIALTVMVLSIAGIDVHAGTPAPAGSSQVGRGLHAVSDSELNLLRGRYTIGNNAVAWFGVRMISTWQTTDGRQVNGALAVGMDFSTGQATPRLSFLPSVSITSANATVPMPNPANAARLVDAGGLANVSGLVQSVQVAGDDNRAGNVVHLVVSDSSASTTPADATPSSGSLIASRDGATASASFDGQAASVRIAIDGLGATQQWIRAGSLGQSVQLTADNQGVSNLMEISLVRQSLAGNLQLTQNVAQAIDLARGLNHP